jgi:hypothetical protein
MKRGMVSVLALAIAAAGLYVRSVRATPASGFSGKTVAMGTFDELDVNLHTIPADIWQAKVKTKGQSDLYVQSNTWQPLATTGWHTHPGPSLVIITAGTVTAYDADDSTCAPHVYSAVLPGVPNHFVDPGGGHVHLVRNEDPVNAATGYAVQLIPQGATRRIDIPAVPASCPPNLQ